MPPKKPAAPPAKGAKAVESVISEANVQLDEKWPLWSDALISSESWDEPLADSEQTLLPSEITERVQQWIRFTEVTKNTTVVYVPGLPQDPAPPEPVAKPSAKPSGKPPAKSAPPPAPVQAPRPQFPAFTKSSWQTFPGIVSQFQLIDTAREQIPPGSLLWELIYPKDATTGLPQVTASGKYAVRIFAFGAWRRVLVDDSVPVDSENRPLLPATVNPELWPMLLYKALLTVAGSCTSAVFSAHPSVIHWLTGLVPQEIPLANAEEIWTQSSELCNTPGAIFALGDPELLLPRVIEARTNAGLPTGTLYPVKQVCEVTWNIREHYRTYERHAQLLLLRNRAARYQLEMILHCKENIGR